MNKSILIFKDTKHTVLRLFEAFMGTVFLGFITLSGALEEAGYAAVPAVFIPTVLIVDGLIRFKILKDGVVLDLTRDILIYPKSYHRKSIKLSHITSVYPSKTLHSGAQAGTATYTYDLNLKGDFGNETIIFASKESRDALFDAINTQKKEA